MEWFMDSRFEPAYKAAADVIENMKYDGKMVSINDVIAVVRDKKQVKILIGMIDFAELGDIEGDYGQCGAAMSVPTEQNQEAPQVAKILVNSHFSPEHRRFSIVHELGHLMTGFHTATTSENRFKVSMHIDADITSIDEDMLKKDDLYVNEQIANIFALLVLMPTQAFVTARNLLKSESLIAQYFGVEKDAVYSRIKLFEKYGR